MSSPFVTRRFDAVEFTLDTRHYSAAESSTCLVLTLSALPYRTQYLISWGIRGDNTPEYAKYLGCKYMIVAVWWPVTNFGIQLALDITSKDLYPDFKFVTFEEFLQKVLDGHAKGVYPEMKEMIAALKKAQQ